MKSVITREKREREGNEKMHGKKFLILDHWCRHVFLLYFSRYQHVTFFFFFPHKNFLVSKCTLQKSLSFKKILRIKFVRQRSIYEILRRSMYLQLAFREHHSEKESDPMLLIKHIKDNTNRGLQR